MIKTLKTIFAVAVSFSIVTISNAFADGHMGAIKKWSNGEFSLSTLSAKALEIVTIENETATAKIVFNVLIIISPIYCYCFF